MGFSNLLMKTLDPPFAPMVYVMMLVNVLIGAFFLFGFLGVGSESILYQAGSLIDSQLWGGLLLATASVGMAGLIWTKDRVLELSGIVGFMLWLFTCIELFMDGYVYVLITIGLFHLLFYGYVYLATATKVIYRNHIYRLE